MNIEYKFIKERVMKKRFTPQILFYTVWVIFAVVSVCWLIHTKAECLDRYIAAKGADKFMDFFNHIEYVRINGWSNVYSASIHACFPPLIYFMYGFLGFMLPPGAIKIQTADATSPYALLLYVWYCVLIGIIFAVTVFKMIDHFKCRYCKPIAVILMLIT